MVLVQGGGITHSCPSLGLSAPNPDAAVRFKLEGAGKQADVLLEVVHTFTLFQ